MGQVNAALSNKDADYAWVLDRVNTWRILRSINSFKYEDVLQHISYTNKYNNFTNGKQSLEYEANIFIQEQVEKEKNIQKKAELRQKLEQFFNDKWKFFRKGLNGEYFVQNYQQQYEEMINHNKNVLQQAKSQFSVKQ